VRRRQRNGLQRWLLRGTETARFRCTNAGCGWNGLLARRLEVDLPTRTWQARAVRGLVPLLLAGMAVLAAQWGAATAPVANVSIGGRQFAPGEAFDGEALPAEHPLLQPVSLQVAGGTEAEATPVRAQALTLRRFCAWGRPGRMPYRGTAEEALTAAQVPPEVRAQIGAAIAAARPHDRLIVANDGIRTATGTQTFDADGFAMTYGRTLCLGTRVNFKSGHVEPASLYEAFDQKGRRYSVMVPDVCGNVSVLRPRGERGLQTVGWPDTPPNGLDLLDPGHPAQRVMHAVLSNKPNEVPTPGTLALSLLAMAAAWATGRQCRARSNRSESPVGGAASQPRGLH